MRPWMINLGVSLVMFVGTIGSFSLLQVSSPNITYAPQQYPGGYPFTPGPRYAPSPLTPEQIAVRNYNACINANSGNSRISRDYIEPYCHCAENDPSSLMYAQCRIQVVTDQSRRPDLTSYFDQRFNTLCTRSYIEHDGRISEAKTPEVCACMTARIQKNPLEAASLASIGFDNDNGKSINADRDQCAAETNAYESTGWQIGERGGQNVAVIELPEHHDIRNIILSCTPQNQMEMRLEYWPHPNRITRLQRDADSYNSGWLIQFQNERAVGKQVSDFYRMALDHLEGVGDKPEQFGEIMPDPSNNRDIEVLFGDFAKRINPVLQACIPDAKGNMNLAAPAQRELPNNALSDTWSYAGRAANYSFPGDFDDKATLNYLRFACDEAKPLLGLGGKFTDDAKARNHLILSTAAGKSMKLPMECGDEEGGTVCYASPDASTLGAMAGSSAVGLKVGDKILGVVPFGGSANIREVLQYCKYSQAAPVSQPKLLPPAATSKVSVGNTIALTGPMNLRAFPADDGRLLKKIPIGTNLMIARKVTDKKGNTWSAVTLSGQQEAGYMKDVALLVNIEGGNASASGR